MLLTVLSLALASCSSGSGGTAFPSTSASSVTIATTTTTTAPAPTTTAVPEDRERVAHAVGERIEVFSERDAPEPAHVLQRGEAPFYDSEADLVFYVLEREPEWVRVLVPVRPNGTEGWVRASDVRVFFHTYRIVVELGAHMLTVYDGDEVWHQEPVGLGVGTTPTPGGLFYTVWLTPPPANQPQYGPWAYGLSGYSEVLYSFAGGDGQFGIHGTNNPDALGTPVSNGCIRMSNEGITKLAETLPIGVPVEIKA